MNYPVIPVNYPVIPVKTGIQGQTYKLGGKTLDSRFRGNDNDHAGMTQNARMTIITRE